MPIYRKAKQMSWYYSIIGVLEKEKVYSHEELVNRLKDIKPGLSDSGYHWAVNRLADDDLLVHAGRGRYSLCCGKKQSEYIPVYSEFARELTDLISNAFPSVRFTVFETVLLNEFLNHLIAQNTIFIQVEKDSSIYVFRFLQEKGLHDLLYKPQKKDFNLYWAKDCTVVSDLISEAPVRTDQPHEITLEKMLVDLCADKLIPLTFSKSELPALLKQADQRYLIDYTKLLRYARRRNRENVIKRYFGIE